MWRREDLTEDIVEQVLVVPRALLAERDLLPEGFSPDGVAEVLRLVASNGFFAPRGEAEMDPSLKQVIPYGPVTCGRRVFLMKRSKKGGDQRLHEKFSIGVGGHVNPEDAREGGLEAAPAAAFDREVLEELVLDSSFRKEAAGLLNDDSTPVGAVHVGIIYRIHLDEPRVRVREEDLLTGELVPIDELDVYGDRMETWSRILKDHFWRS